MQKTFVGTTDGLVTPPNVCAIDSILKQTVLNIKGESDQNAPTEDDNLDPRSK